MCVQRGKMLRTSCTTAPSVDMCHCNLSSGSCLISPTRLEAPLRQKFLNLSLHQNHVEGKLKSRLIGFTPQLLTQ